MKHTISIVLGLILAFLTGCVEPEIPFESSSRGWKAAATLPKDLPGHTTTILNNGKVLVAGGESNLCYLYDPALDSWTQTGSMSVIRSGHAAVLLQDGRVMTAGYSFSDGQKNSSSVVQIYDPMTGSWTTTPPPLTSYGDCLLLPMLDGNVMLKEGSTWEIFDRNTSLWKKRIFGSKYSSVAAVVGSEIYDVQSASVLRYDTTSNSWSTVGLLQEPHRRATVIALSDSEFAVIGGNPGASLNELLSSTEIYNTKTNTSVYAGSMTAARSEWSRRIIRLGNGNILATGSPQAGKESVCEIFSPVTRQWKVIGPVLSPPHSLTLLKDGRVLGIFSGKCDIYQP